MDVTVVVETHSAGRFARRQVVDRHSMSEDDQAVVQLPSYGTFPLHPVLTTFTRPLHGP